MSAEGTWRAVARWDGSWWVVDVEDVGATQGRNLIEAKEMARDLLTAVTGEWHDFVDLDWHVDIGEDLTLEREHAREATAAAAAAQQGAAALSRQIARAMSKQGISGRDIASMLEVSPQRVSQLLAEPISK